MRHYIIFADNTSFLFFLKKSFMYLKNNKKQTLIFTDKFNFIMI